MIDLKTEQLLKLHPDAASAMGKLCNSKTPSRSKMYRLVKQGLETVVVSGSTYTSFEAIIRHIVRTTEERGLTPNDVPQETPAHRRARQESAKRRLAGHGVVRNENSGGSPE